jgi:DNA-binding YbaB/EbfC family protein
MLDNLKNLGNLGQLMSRAGEIRERMQKMQEDLGKRTVTGDAGAGMVTATVSGKLELLKLKVDRARLGPIGEDGKTSLSASDMEMLEDLICAAVRSAQAKAAQLVQDEMAKQASELGLPPGMLPGM